MLFDFCLDVLPGECLTVIGSSGCGKTTMLKMVNGLIHPHSGQVLVDGQDVSACDQIQLRRRMGYVIQGAALFPHMTVGKNITYVPELDGRLSTAQKQDMIRDLLTIVGLDPEYQNRYPSELSGGQQQRVGIARALASAPKILLMDEPFGALDGITRRALQKELMHIHKKLSSTILFVTHDIDEALKLGDRVLVMDAGKIIQLDKPENILANPATDFVRELIGK